MEKKYKQNVCNKNIEDMKLQVKKYREMFKFSVQEMRHGEKRPVQNFGHPPSWLPARWSHHFVKCNKKNWKVRKRCHLHYQVYVSDWCTVNPMEQEGWKDGTVIIPVPGNRINLNCQTFKIRATGRECFLKA